MAKMEEIKTMLADMNKKLDKVIFQNKIALNTKYGLPITQEIEESCCKKFREVKMKQEDSILSITVEMHDEVEQQAIKDTAKEICDLILEHWQGHDLVECDWLIVAISEKYGLDMK